jgi:putative restriction endonuclease
LQEPTLQRIPSLHVRFNAFSSIALPRWGGKVDLSYPFFYLKSQGFWQALNNEMRPSTSVEVTQSIQLDPEFLALMQDADFRRSARIILVETYFPPAERIALYALLGVPAQTQEFQRELHLLNTDTATQAVKQGRSARFGVQVVCGYQHTCALTGYRIITQNGESVVEAAHIEPWAKTRNDDIHNGLALSRNVHWAFDRGLWSVNDPVGDQFPILIKPERFQEWGPEALGLLGYEKSAFLKFAEGTSLRPEPDYLRRHRQQWGF